jgi:hypothetical protein
MEWFRLGRRRVVGTHCDVLLFQSELCKVICPTFLAGQFASSTASGFVAQVRRANPSSLSIEVREDQHGCHQRATLRRYPLSSKVCFGDGDRMITELERTIEQTFVRWASGQSPDDLGICAIDQVAHASRTRAVCSLTVWWMYSAARWA